MVLVSPDTAAGEVERTDVEIRETGYQGPITFRPPYGKKLWVLPKYLSDHDRTTVMCDVEPDSADDPSAEEIVAGTVDRVPRLDHPAARDVRRPRGVAGGDTRHSLRATHTGYRFVTVSDLIGRSC